MAVNSSRIWFPLRSNIAYFETVSPQLNLESRIKQVALLADELLFEPGMVTVDVTEDLVFGPIYHPHETLDAEDIVRRRRASQTGKRFALHIGLQPAPGVPAPPEAMHTLGGGELQHGFVAEYHLLLERTGLAKVSWVGMGEIPAEASRAAEALAAQRTQTERFSDAPRLSENDLLDSALKKDLNLDLAFSQATGLPVAIDELHRPMLEWKARVAGSGTKSERAPGALALHLWAPNFTYLSWKRIIELHDHDAIGAFRAKLVEAEEQVVSLPEEEQEVALRDIGYREALEKVRALTPTRSDVAVDVAAGVVFDWLPFGGVAYSTATGIAKLQRAETEWTAVLLALTAKNHSGTDSGGEGQHAAASEEPPLGLADDRAVPRRGRRHGTRKA